MFVHRTPRHVTWKVPLRFALWAAAVCLLIAAGEAVRAQSKGPAVRPNTAALPTVQDVLKKAIERAKWSDEQKFENKYAWTRHQITEQYDSKGNVKKREDKVYQVFPIDGESYSRLVQKDGKSLAGRELRVEQENERKFRETVARKKRQPQSAHRKKDYVDDLKFDAVLIARYQWDVTGREAVNGRPAFILSFQPRPNWPVKRIIDRLLNRAAGRLWVDEKDYEIARVDLHLAENVSAWGGILASVKKFVLRFEQTKVDQMAWLPSYIDGYLDGRILIKTLRVKVLEQHSEFRPATVAAAQPTPTKK
ncbi:MAG TPA: hypothetical protein VI699_07160 [Candidatus Acidoferrales bacterium]|nr:hypothetical protein [Candidatus Acidoferrales bacterium]